MKRAITLLLWFLIIGRTIPSCQEPLPPAPVLKVETTEYQVDYRNNVVTVPYSIKNANYQDVSASTSDNWLKEVEIQEDEMSFIVEENNSGKDRRGYVVLTCPGKEIKITIFQSWSDIGLALKPAHIDVGYSGNSGSFSFTIQNPREGVEVSCRSDVNWINELSINDKTVGFDIIENASGLTRSGSIILEYGRLSNTVFRVTQDRHPITTFSLTPSSLKIMKGDTVRLLLTVFPEDSEVIWTSSNTSVVAVDSDGQVTAKSKGSAVVTVKSKDGKESLSCSITVSSVEGDNEEIGEQIWI